MLTLTSLRSELLHVTNKRDMLTTTYKHYFHCGKEFLEATTNQRDRIRIPDNYDMDKPYHTPRGINLQYSRQINRLRLQTSINNYEQLKATKYNSCKT